MRIKDVTLGLQGGGSHGAFTWGVLERLLEEERITIKGISGVSAGAMNAVVFAHGFTVGGREGARQALKDFWDAIATEAPFHSTLVDAPPRLGQGLSASATPALKALLFLTRFFSPYQLNPFDVNPLRDILLSQLDFGVLRTSCRIELFIAATRVSTGTLRLFRTKELTVDALLASSCLPSLHHSIEIDGESYWDGGLTANPPVLPLLHQCSADDVILVLLHPAPSPHTPRTAEEISERLSEIGFGATLSTELEGLMLAKREAGRGLFSIGRFERRLRRLHLHLIDSPEFMSQLSSLSKANRESTFIKALHDEGRNRAELWLEKNFDLVGKRWP